MIRWLVGMILALVATPARADGQWLRMETEHFVLYSDGTEKELRADATKLERFDQMMRVVTGIKDDNAPVKLTVYFVNGMGRVQTLYGGKAKRVAGFYAASLAGALAVVPRNVLGLERSKDRADFDDYILFHEYAHHLMQQYFPIAYPAWYSEGFAEYVGNSRVETDGTVKLGLPNQYRAYTFSMLTPMAIDRLLVANVEDLRGYTVDALYGRGWLLTHYLHFEPSREGQLNTYLAALASGTLSLDAGKQAFGDLATLDADLNGYLRRRKISYRALKLKTPYQGEGAVTTLSAAQSAAIPLKVRLDRGTRPQERQSPVDAAQKLVTQFPDDAHVLTLLAEAQIDAGNFTAAGATADAAIALDPKNSRALLWKGLSLSRPLAAAGDRDPSKWKQARSFIIKANHANPNDPIPLVENYVSLVQSGKEPTASAIDGVRMAVDLVPQSVEARMNYAVALARTHSFDEAIKVLQPVVNDPHPDKMTAVARDLVVALGQAKTTGQFDPALLNTDFSGADDEE